MHYDRLTVHYVKNALSFWASFSSSILRIAEFMNGARRNVDNDEAIYYLQKIFPAQNEMG